MQHTNNNAGQALALVELVVQVDHLNIENLMTRFSTNDFDIKILVKILTNENGTLLPMEPSNNVVYKAALGFWCIIF